MKSIILLRLGAIMFLITVLILLARTRVEFVYTGF